MDVSCPQCGNPQLDVDAENSVVYCRNCGFAVKVDPQTGQATPISMGQGGGGGAETPAGPAMPYAGGGGGGGFSGEKLILGTEPLTFLLGGTVVALLLVLMLNIDSLIARLFWLVVLYIYFTNH